MSSILTLAVNWKKWFRVLHYNKGLGWVDSVRKARE